MPIAKPKQQRPKDRPATPVCEDCGKAMLPTLSVPLPNAPGFEDIYYECPVCKAEVKRTAIPE
jgi:hypothetical protein